MTCRGYWGAEFDCLRAGSSLSDLDGELISPEGSVTCEEGSARSGKFGYRCVMGSGGRTSRVKFGGQQILPGQVVSWRVYVRLEGYPPVDTIFAQFGSGFLNQDIYLRPNGRVHFGGSPQQIPNNDIPIPLGSWVRIEVALGYSDPAIPTPQGSIFQVRVNGESIHRRCRRAVGPLSPSGGVEPAYDTCLIGWGDSPSPGLAMDFDDVGIYEGVWGGDASVERLQVTSMDLEERWVPGSWRNVYKHPGPDDAMPPFGDCYCGDIQFGTYYPPANFDGMVTGFNATPPTGFSAGHSLDIGGGEGRDYGEDYMVSSPGREVMRKFIDGIITACVGCGADGGPGLGGSNEYTWNYETRYPPEADPVNSLTCQLGGASGGVRAARWAILAARGDPFPGGVSGVGTGYTASVFLHGLDAPTRNLDFSDGHGFGEGGDFPDGWTGRVGPIHDSPGGVSTVEMERDPGSTLMQVCMMTAVVEVGLGTEEIEICKQHPMSWT